MALPQDPNRPVKIGIIGGTGLDDPDIFSERKEEVVTTPYGKPSDSLITGNIGDVPCVLLARHGRNHTINPTEVNYRANVWAMKDKGCTHLIVTTACGSLQEEMAPGHIVLLDQFIDRTLHRKMTFFDGADNHPKGVCHVPMAEPFCNDTREVIINTAKELNLKYHPKGTNITVEGPRFSTRAESKVWRMYGASVINMSTVPEVILAREAALCYASIALVTDYDCWREGTDHVNVEDVMKVFKENVENVKQLLIKTIPRIAAKDWSSVLKKYEEEVSASTMSA